jgi:hypothetical protein
MYKNSALKLYQEIPSAGSGREIASYMPKILLFTHTAYIGIHFIFIHDFQVRDDNCQLCLSYQRYRWDTGLIPDFQSLCL